VTGAAKATSGTLLLGLGNDILTDDAIGLMIAGELREELGGSGIEVIQTAEMGLSLLDLIAGYRNVVLVDAVLTNRAPPGHLHEFDAEQLSVLPAISPHFLGVGEMLAVGRQLGMQMPDCVRILAVEVLDPFTVGASLTPELSRALPSLVKQVKDRVSTLSTASRAANVE
jgi:hydrogenase maturation protease